MTKTLFLDLLERAGWTAAQAFLAVFTVSDLSTARTGAIAAAAAVLSLVKGFVASRSGDGSAATLPAPH